MSNVTPDHALDSPDSRLKWRIDVEDYVSDEDDETQSLRKNRDLVKGGKVKDDVSVSKTDKLDEKSSVLESITPNGSSSNLSQDFDPSKKKTSFSVDASESNDKFENKSRQSNSENNYDKHDGFSHKSTTDDSIHPRSSKGSQSMGQAELDNVMRNVSNGNYDSSNMINNTKSNENVIKDTLIGRRGVTAEKVSSTVKKVEPKHESMLIQDRNTSRNSSIPTPSSQPYVPSNLNIYTSTSASYSPPMPAPSTSPSPPGPPPPLAQKKSIGSEDDPNSDELVRLTETLKAVRRKPADTSEELEIKTYKISMLQAAIRDARARSRSGDSGNRSSFPLFPADTIGTGGNIVFRSENIRKSFADVPKSSSTPPRPTPPAYPDLPLPSYPPMNSPSRNDYANNASAALQGNNLTDSPEHNPPRGGGVDPFPPRVRVKPPLSPQVQLANGYSLQDRGMDMMNDPDLSRKNSYASHRSQTMPPTRHSAPSFDSSPSSPKSDRSFPVTPMTVKDNQSMQSMTSSSHMRRSFSTPQGRRVHPEGSLTSSSHNPLAMTMYSPNEANRSIGGMSDSIDVQNFSKLVTDMQAESEQLIKLKQQNKLLHGWYTEAKVTADGNALQALEAKARADVSEEWAANTCRQMTELEEKVEQLKENIMGSHMLENENSVLRKRILILTSSKPFKMQMASEVENGQANSPSPSKDPKTGVLARPGRATELAESSPNRSYPKSQSSASGLEDFNKWVVEMQEEVGTIEMMKKVNKLLQGWYSEANSRIQDSIAKIHEEHTRAKEADEMTAAGQVLVRDLEMKRAELLQRYAHRLLLEEENKELHQKILVLTSGRGSQISQTKLQERLLKTVSENIGFNKGRPVAACIIHKAMSHWQIVQVERSSILDKVIAIMQASTTSDAPQDAFCYWMSNSSTLHFLKSHGPSRVDALLAREHLGAEIERLYVAVRNNNKSKILSLLTSDVQVNNYWSGITSTLRDLFDDLRLNYVPPFLARALFHQLVSVIDTKVFNNIVMHNPWWPCTMSNGELIASGLSNFDDWLAEVDDWLDSNIGEKVQLLKPLSHNLRHLRQAVILLVEEDKPSRTLKELQALCPDLTITQLAQICTRFEYERDSVTPGFSPAMIEQMWALGPTTEDFLLKDDKGIPFSIDELYNSFEEFDIEDIQPPAVLRDTSFYFLQPTAPSQLLLTQGSPIGGSNASNALALRRLTM